MYTLFSYAEKEGSELYLAHSVLDILGLESPKSGITVLYGHASSKAAYPIVSDLIKAQGHKPVFVHMSGPPPVGRATLGDTDKSYKNITSASIPLSKADARKIIASSWEAADYADNPSQDEFEDKMPVKGTKKPYLLDAVKNDCDLLDNIKIATYDVVTLYGVFTVATIWDFADIDFKVIQGGDVDTIKVPGFGHRKID